MLGTWRNRVHFFVAGCFMQPQIFQKPSLLHYNKIFYCISRIQSRRYQKPPKIYSAYHQPTTGGSVSKNKGEYRLKAQQILKRKDGRTWDALWICLFKAKCTIFTLLFHRMVIKTYAHIRTYCIKLHIHKNNPCFLVEKFLVLFRLPLSGNITVAKSGVNWKAYAHT